MSKRYSLAVTLSSLAVGISGCVSEPASDTRIRLSTVEILSTSSPNPGQVGTGFFIEPYHFATAAHVLDGFLSGRWEPKLLVPGRWRAPGIGDVVRYSADEDFAVLSLSPEVEGVAVDVPKLPSGSTAVRYGGHVPPVGIGFAQGTLRERSEDSIRFEGPVWQGISGGALFEAESGGVLGMVVEWKNGLSRAVPIETLESSKGSDVVISVASALHPLDMDVLDDEPLTEHFSLPLPYRMFGDQLRSHRDALYVSIFSRYASTPAKAFTLSGPWANEGCEFLNGRKCDCPAPLLDGAPKIVAPQPYENALDSGLLVYNLQGAVVVRDQRARRFRSLTKKAGLHRDLAQMGLQEPVIAYRIGYRDAQALDTTALKKSADQTYTDKQNRTWIARIWSLLGTDWVLVSLGRDLADSHLVLLQAVPQEYENGALGQLEFIANYAYACPAKTL